MIRPVPDNTKFTCDASLSADIPIKPATRANWPVSAVTDSKDGAKPFDARIMFWKVPNSSWLVKIVVSAADCSPWNCCSTAS